MCPKRVINVSKTCPFLYTLKLRYYWERLSLVLFVERVITDRVMASLPFGLLAGLPCF